MCRLVFRPKNASKKLFCVSSTGSWVFNSSFWPNSKITITEYFTVFDIFAKYVYLEVMKSSSSIWLFDCLNEPKFQFVINLSINLSSGKHKCNSGIVCELLVNIFRVLTYQSHYLPLELQHMDWTFSFRLLARNQNCQYKTRKHVLNWSYSFPYDKFMDKFQFVINLSINLSNGKA